MRQCIVETASHFILYEILVYEGWDGKPSGKSLIEGYQELTHLTISHARTSVQSIDSAAVAQLNVQERTRQSVCFLAHAELVNVPRRKSKSRPKSFCAVLKPLQVYGSVVDDGAATFAWTFGHISPTRIR